MWVSERSALRQKEQEEAAAVDLGVTTIGGAHAAVETRGEQREVEVFAPGGIVWQPQEGDTVLVVRGGSGGDEQCIAGASTADKAPEGMAPGELFLYGPGKSAIYLRADGTILLRGRVMVDGALFINGRLCPACM